MKRLRGQRFLTMVLNAKNHEHEQRLFRGWKEGSVTVATNMAVRGSDIKIDGWRFKELWKGLYNNKGTKEGRTNGRK